MRGDPATGRRCADRRVAGAAQPKRKGSMTDDLERAVLLDQLAAGEGSGLKPELAALLRKPKPSERGLVAAYVSENNGDVVDFVAYSAVARAKRWARNHGR